MKYIRYKICKNVFAFTKITILLILCHLLIVDSVLAISNLGNNRNTDIRNSIVKIYTVASEPRYYSPWILDNPTNSTGSGCIISEKRILTNAHVISNQKFIEVQLYGHAERYNAKVSFVSHEADLAILTVEDTSFFTDIEPIELGLLPETLQEVLVYGFPTGGDSLSITKGILSRVEYQEYVHSNYQFLAGQIDAAINPGNSGGPVIVDNKVVGVAMQKINSEDIDNIGYMIPAPIIKHFLTDVEDGRYDGFPEIGFLTQNMENPGMKEKFGMTNGETGVLVNHVYWNSAALGKVEMNDVILSIDGHHIADNGTIEFRPGERTLYTYYSDLHQIGDTINLKILRNGEMKHISYPLNQTGADISLVASKQYDSYPRYFIFAGIVFSPLTENLLCAWEDCDAPDELNVIKNKKPSKSRQEVVVAVQVLPDDINKGYHDSGVWVVNEVNGLGFKDFNEFHRLVVTSNDQFIVFRADDETQVVIDRKKAEERHEKILQTYNIKQDSSFDIPELHKDNYLISNKH